MKKYQLPDAAPLLVGEPQTIGAYEAKTHLPRLLDDVAAGQAYVITKHGRPVARLVPPEPQSQSDQVIDALFEFRERRTLGDVSVRALRDQGRS